MNLEKILKQTGKLTLFIVGLYIGYKVMEAYKIDLYEHPYKLKEDEYKEMIFI